MKLIDMYFWQMGLRGVIPTLLAIVEELESIGDSDDR
jgi:hypothetical protein